MEGVGYRVLDLVIRVVARCVVALLGSVVRAIGGVDSQRNHIFHYGGFPPPSVAKHKVLKSVNRKWDEGQVQKAVSRLEGPNPVKDCEGQERLGPWIVHI